MYGRDHVAGGHHRKKVDVERFVWFWIHGDVVLQCEEGEECLVMECGYIGLLGRDVWNFGLCVFDKFINHSNMTKV